MPIQFTPTQIQHLSQGGVALSNGEGRVEVLQKPVGGQPLEWSKLQGQLSKELGGFRPIGKGEVVGALWREAGLNGAPGNSPAGRALKDRLVEILKNKDDTPAAAATAFGVYQSYADQRSVGAVSKGDVPAPAKTETKSAAGGVAGDKEAANRVAPEGIKQSKDQLEVYVRRHAGTLPRQDIAKMVSKALQAAYGDPQLSAKLSSASLEPRELESLAKVGIRQATGLIGQHVDDD